MKGFKVEFSDGTSWLIPLEVIAKIRTDYYAIKVDGYRSDSAEYKKEYEYSLSSPSELLDWIANNTNWEDVKDYAIQYSESKPIAIRDNEYRDQEFEIIDVDILDK